MRVVQVSSEHLHMALIKGSKGDLRVRCMV